MAQTLLAFDDTHPADPQVGFDLGWDHARHGLLPPPEQWLDGNPLHQGWRAGKACFGARTLGASRRVRLWLALRLHAWLRGRAFELAEVTPHYLGQIEVALCPITRRAAGPGRDLGRPGLRPGRLCRRQPGDDVGAANRAKAALGWDEALVAGAAGRGAEGGRVDGLDAAAWAAAGGADVLRHAAAARAGGAACRCACCRPTGCAC